MIGELEDVVYSAASAVENSSIPFQVNFASGWDYMVNNYSELTITTWFTIALNEIVFFGLYTPWFLAQYLPFMKRFKIQQAKPPESFESQWKCFKLILFNHFCIQIPMIFGASFISVDVHYKYRYIPKWYMILLQLFGCLVVDDMWHYFTHRLLHHKHLYKYVHKVHHHFQSPFGMVSDYTHWIETLILSTCFTIGVIFFCNHLVISWLWMIIRQMETIQNHCGYDFPYLNPLYYIPGYAGARFHDFHHSNFNGNYASIFVWWDWLFGTDKQWKEFCAAEEKKKK